MNARTKSFIAFRARDCALLLMFGLGFVATAYAGATQSDVLVAARALGFLETPPTGEINVGIVYQPTNPASAADAANLAKMLAGGLQVGNLVLKPVLVTTDQLDKADVKLFFLTDGLGPAAAKVGAASAARKIPCVTADLDEVRTGACAMGVTSAPKVEIEVNRAAAAASGTVFASIFRMMITEF